MCPLCLTSLAVTVTATTGVGAGAAAVVTRVARSLVRRPADGDVVPPAAPAGARQPTGGGR